MPFKSLKPCTHQGCHKLTTGGPCEEHRRKERQRYDDNRGTSTERGYDAQWQKVRRVKLNSDPLCEVHTERGYVVVAVLVHHIKPVSEYPELRLVKSNLMSLCNECHEEIHGKDRFKRT
jgi:5-methylcytosine-specific restriction protein A